MQTQRQIAQAGTASRLTALDLGQQQLSERFDRRQVRLAIAELPNRDTRHQGIDLEGQVQRPVRLAGVGRAPKARDLGAIADNARSRQIRHPRPGCLGLEQGEPRGGSVNGGVFDDVGSDERAEPGGRGSRAGGETKLSLVAALEPCRGEGGAELVRIDVEAGRLSTCMLLDLLFEIEERARLLAEAGQADVLQIDRGQRHRREIERFRDGSRRGERRDSRTGPQGETWGEAGHEEQQRHGRGPAIGNASELWRFATENPHPQPPLRGYPVLCAGRGEHAW